MDRYGLLRGSIPMGSCIGTRKGDEELLGRPAIRCEYAGSVMVKIHLAFVGTDGSS